MMPIKWLRQTEQRLQHDVNIGRGLKIDATYDMTNALQDIIDDNGEMITCRQTFARDDGITPAQRIGRNAFGLPCMRIEPMPSQGPG